MSTFGRLAITGLCVTALLLSFNSLTLAQSDNLDRACADYYAAIAGDQTKDQKVSSPIPGQLLSNWQNAVPCIVRYLRTLQNTITSPNIENSDVLPRFLRATGAVRIIMANNTDPKALSAIIKAFREANDLPVTTVLTFAARSDDYNARLNSMLILANVIDNTTVCVPLDHLYDPNITVNGRANLLSIVSVVAPWAYFENWTNIKATIGVMESNPAIMNDARYSQTREILQNVKSRLESNTEESNRGVCLSRDIQRCKGYTPRWAAENLKYACPH